MRTDNGNWQAITYQDFRTTARNIAQSFLHRRLSPARPIAILAGNSIEHALFAVAAMYAGIPYAPLPPAYWRTGSSFRLLRQVLSTLDPQLIFAADGHHVSSAIEACIHPEIELVRRSSSLASTLATEDVDLSQQRVQPEACAKILFTSGSIDAPKGVVNTHRMLTSNQEMLRAVIPSLAMEPPVLCDWLPWHHTFGGNQSFGLVLYNGGTLYIDGGAPTTAGIKETIANLRETSPSFYFNVPKGFDLLANALQTDPVLRQRFFSRLRGMFCAAASLSQETGETLRRLSREARGVQVPLMAGYGATETGPLALFDNGETNRAGVIGLPVPGVEVKLADTGGKLELRVRGPNVTPGYWRRADLTRAAFDDEGFYATGDAVHFLDPCQPLLGLLFEGRLAEDFKLSTGSWVNVGALRTLLLRHCGPLIQDVAIAGHGRDEITALIFPNRQPSRNPSVASIEASLKDFVRRSTNSSDRIARAVIVNGPPSRDAGEVTGKGSLNQNAVLANRARLVEDLYAIPTPPHVLQLTSRPAKTEPEA